MSVNPLPSSHVKLYHSSWDLENVVQHSSWDENPATTNNASTTANAATGVTTTAQSLHLQLVGVIAVLLILVAMVVPVTLAISGYKITTIVTTIITTTTTTSMTSTTTTADPYACGNMTYKRSWNYNGNDIPSASFGSANYSVCCASCLALSTCKAFTCSSGTCYPKSSTGSGGYSVSGQDSAAY